MITLVESIAMVILLILMILLISHLINGTAIEWLKSKVTIQGAAS